MFGWFSGKSKEKEYSPSKDDKAQAFYEALPPAKQELYNLLTEVKAYDSSAHYRAWTALYENDDATLKQALLNQVIPAVPPELQQRIKNIGKGSGWATTAQIVEAGLSKAQPPFDRLYPGWFGTERGDALLQFFGEGHLLTVAPTGAGKGQGHIIPALLDYKGPVIVLDPKGENYRETAWRRRWCGDVFKWAPFEDETDTFNPLDFVQTYDDARVLAGLLMAAASDKDPFWDRSAKDLLIGLILYVKKDRSAGLQNMREVCRLLAPSKEEYKQFLSSLQESGEERLLETANILEDQSESVRMNVFQTLRAHLDVWRSDEITRTTSTTTEDFYPSEILNRQAMHDLSAALGQGGRSGPSVDLYENADGTMTQSYTRGSGGSVFLIMPSDKISSYAGVMRVILGMFINEITKAVSALEQQDIPDTRGYQTPVMFLLDELPQLGYMDVLENAIAIARSSRIRLWLFAQALDQLTAIYPKADTLIANCRMKMFFRPADLKTAQYISEHLGELENIFGDKTWLATPQELMGPDYLDFQVALVRGSLPIKSRLRLKYKDPELLDFEREYRPYWEEQDDRKDMSGRLFEQEPSTDS